MELLPKRHILDRWVNSVGDNFKFSMKDPQVVTHRKDINDYTAKNENRRIYFRCRSIRE